MRGPPCRAAAGRPCDPLNILHRNMTHPRIFNRVRDDIIVCDCEHISLPDYVANLPRYCSLVHKTTCSVCPALIHISNIILEKGFLQLSEAFKSAFPDTTYHSHSAKRRLLQLPLVVVRVGQPQSGISEVFLF